MRNPVVAHFGRYALQDACRTHRLGTFKQEWEHGRRSTHIDSSRENRENSLVF